MREKRVFKLLSIVMLLSVIFPLVACNKSEENVSEAIKDNKYNESNGLEDSSNEQGITDVDVKQITKDEMNNVVSKYKVFANNAMKVSNYLMEDPVNNKENCAKVLADMKNEKEELSKIVPDCLKENLNNYMDQFINISEKSLDECKYNHEDYDECDNNRYNFEIKAKIVLDKLHMDTNFY